MTIRKYTRHETSTTVRFTGWVNSITVHDVAEYHAEQRTAVMFFHAPPSGSSAIVRIMDPHGVLAHAIRTFNPEADGDRLRLMDLIQSARPIDDAGPEAHAAWDAFLREFAPAH